MSEVGKVKDAALSYTAMVYRFTDATENDLCKLALLAADDPFFHLNIVLARRLTDDDKLRGWVVVELIGGDEEATREIENEYRLAVNVNVYREDDARHFVNGARSLVLSGKVHGALRVEGPATIKTMLAATKGN